MLAIGRLTKPAEREFPFESGRPLSAMLSMPQEATRSDQDQSARDRKRAQEAGKARFHSDAVQAFSEILQGRVVYPLLARRMGWHGLVVVAASVAADGNVTSVSIAQSSGHGVLDSAAVDAVRAYRFPPGPGVETTHFRFRFHLTE